MWKRDESVAATPAARPQSAGRVDTLETPEGVARIGKSVVIKGDLIASEDLLIEGSVEGRIELRANVLTIGPDGRIKADIVAKSAIVEGQVIGKITATERVEIRDDGSLEGDLSS